MNKQPFVLIVEDDQQLRQIVSRTLRATGYMVFEAGSFRAAVDQMTITPNVIILDINLPDGTGWDAADWLEQMTTPVPIIVTSGATPDPKRLQRFKPKAFLAKPFSMSELLKLVKQFAPVGQA